MAAESAIMEALARVEHKLDLLLNKAAFDWLPVEPGTKGPMKMGNPGHTCPVCLKQVKYLLDPFQKIVSRQCDCKTGLLAPMDLSLFAPPIPKKENRDERTVQEDGSDSDRRRGK